jgi:hypothetical protein
MAKGTKGGSTTTRDSKPEKVQVRNPIIDRWVKLDTRTGRIVSTKKSPGPYKNVPRK